MGGTDGVTLARLGGTMFRQRCRMKNIGSVCPEGTSEPKNLRGPDRIVDAPNFMPLKHSIQKEFGFIEVVNGGIV